LEPEARASPVSVDPLPAIDKSAELFQLLAELPARQRAVLVLRYFNDLTEAQVAESRWRERDPAERPRHR
jgi:DNA-directed RNA polymerase specialized sigma24 family protein